MKRTVSLKGRDVEVPGQTSGFLTTALPGICNSQRSTRSSRATKLLIVLLATVAAGPISAALDHFDWSGVPSPQHAGTPFAVTVTARDAQNGIVADYAGPAILRGIQGEPASTHVLWGDPRHQDFLWGPWGAKTGGYAFTPWADLWVTHVRHYFGERVSVWSDDGVLLADRPVQSEAGVWRETPLIVPLRLAAGRTYRVTVRSELFHHYYQTNRPPEFAYGLLGPSYLANEDGFPTEQVTNYLLLVDLRYTVGGESSVPVVPETTGVFQDGVWTGEVAVAQAASGTLVRADDGFGHAGDTVRFDVVAADDVALMNVEPPSLITLGDQLRYTLAVTNTGPAGATALRLTNELPAGVVFVSAQVSQGVFTNVGSAVICELGDLPGGGHAEITLELAPGVAGVVALRSGISRSGLDGNYGNNSRVAITRVYDPPTITLGDTQVLEGDGTTNASVTVSLWPPSSRVVSVSYSATNGTAMAGTDYSAGVGLLIVPPGITNRTISVPILGDLLNEVEETVSVQLSGATNGTIARATAVIGILDDDPLPTISMADAALTEGSGGTNQLAFGLTLSSVSGRLVSVGYSATGLTATPGLDFLPVWGTVSFPPGATQASVSVPVKADFAPEQDETLLVQLDLPLGATLAQTQAVGTLFDDDGAVGEVDHFAWDPMPSFPQVARSFPAGLRALDAFNEIVTNYNETVALSAWSGAVRRPVRVTSFTRYADRSQDYPRTLAAIAAYFTDFVETHTEATNACDLAAQLADQDVFLVVAQRTAPTNLMTNLGQAWSGVLSNFVVEGGMVVVCGSPQQEQQILGASGLMDVTYTRTRPAVLVSRSLNHPLSLGLSASFTGTNITTYGRTTSGTTIFRDSSANPVVLSRGLGAGQVVLIGCDYARTGTPMDRVIANAIQWARGTPLPVTPLAPVRFTNGMWTGPVSVNQVSPVAYLIGDDGASQPAASDPFRVIATNGLGLAWQVSTPVATVHSNVTFELTVWNAGLTATNVLVTNQLPSTLSLISANASQGTYTWDGSNLVCSLGSLTNGALARVALEATPTDTGLVTVVAAGRRSQPEPDLTDNHATVSLPVLPPLALTIADAAAQEGPEGQAFAAFDVTLSRLATNTVTVDFATVEGTALEGIDYAGVAGTLAFPPYCTRQTISVPILDDALLEVDEQFLVRLSQPANAPLARADGLGIIRNDDFPALSVVDVTLMEGESGTAPLELTVTLSDPAPFPVSVHFTTADGTALAGRDYVAASGQLDFPPGTVQQMVAVTVVGDSLGELTETFFLRLAESVNATIARDQGEATLLDNDPTALSIDPVRVLEGDTGNTNAVFTVRLVPPADRTVAVRYATADGTAVAGEDYQAVTGELVFPPGITAREVPVRVFGDRVNEAEESFGVQLSHATNAPIGDAEAAGFISNDDPLPSIAIGNASAAEGHTGTNSLRFPVHLSVASGQTVTVGFTVSDGTALAGQDYLGSQGTLVFPRGLATQEIVVGVLGDRLNETNETLFVALTTPTNALLGVAQGLGTIVNDDAGAGVFHHLEWGPIGSPQVAAEAFPVQLTAVDVDGWLVPDFTNTVTFGAAKAGGPESFTIEGALAHHNVVSIAPSTWGYRFTPSTSLLVTHLRYYTGTKISLWTDAGELLVAQEVQAAPGQWQETPLADPVRLFAGRAYRLALYTGGEPYYESYFTEAPFAHGTVNQRCSGSGDAFPEVNTYSILPLVDFRYTVDQSLSGAVTPAVSGGFTNGVWAGELTVTTEPAPIYLRADAAGGQAGFSQLFGLEYANDLKLELAADQEAVYQGDTVVLTLTVANLGPGPATAIAATNILPTGLTFLSASGTQGTWSQAGGSVSWNLGDLPESSQAALAVTVTADAIGTLTNRAALGRQEADAWLANNTASLVLTVLAPLDYFAFAPLTNVAEAQIPFTVRVEARNAQDQVVTSYSGTGTVRASRLFQEDFEDGDFEGWEGLVMVPAGPEYRPSLEVTQTTAGEGHRSLLILGSDGATKALGGIVPTRLSFRLRLWEGMPVGLLDLYCPSGEGIHFGTHTGIGQIGILAPDGTFHGAPYQAERWYHVELVFHRDTKNLDYHLDGQLVAAGVPYPSALFAGFSSVHIGSHIANVSWWDDIQFFGDPLVHDTQVLPTQMISFSNGVSTVDLAIADAATNLQFTVENPTGRRGLSSTFSVVPGPHGVFHHLAWDPIPSPVLVNQPVPVTLRAEDLFGNVATNFGGPAQISAKRRDTVQVLAFAGYSDLGTAFSNTLAAVSATMTNCHVTITTNLDLLALTRDLAGKDVFLMPYQRYATEEGLTNLATQWRDGLDEFVRAGGVVVTCGGATFLSASGLMAVQLYGMSGFTWVTAAPNHFLTQGVESTFYVNDGISYYSSSDAESVVGVTAGGPVVLSRDLGLGHVVLIGTGFHNIGSPLDLVLANSVRWAQQHGLSPANLTVGNPVQLINGTWTGEVSVPEPADELYLFADAGGLRTGFSNPFAVGVTNDLGLSVAVSAHQLIVGTPLTCTLVVTNHGPLPATGIVLTNRFPSSANLSFATTSQGTLDASDGELVCQVGSLPGGGQAVIVFTLTPNATGMITNQANVSRGESDFFAANNEATAVIEVWPPPALVALDATGNEGNTNETSLVFTVQLFPPAATNVTVDWLTLDGSAVAGQDYVGASGRLTFPPGIIQQTVSVPVIGDTLSENAETLSLVLTNSVNAPISGVIGTGTILDDADPFPSFLLDSEGAAEGDAGTRDLVFTGRLSAPSGRTVSVHYRTVRGSATPGQDFVAVEADLVIPPGSTQRTFGIPLQGDLLVEPDEVFFVELSAPSNVGLTYTQCGGLIQDDDTAPVQLDHFAVSHIASPQRQGQPFTLTVTARDYLDQLLPGEQGPFHLTAHTRGLESRISVLLFSRYLDSSRSNGTLAALAQYRTNVDIESTTVIDPATLAALLGAKDVFLVPAQSTPGVAAGLGEAWAGVLSQFVLGGGVVIVCSDNYDEHLLLSRSGLLEAQKSEVYFPGGVTSTFATRLTWGVPGSFLAPSITTYIPQQADVVLRRLEDGLPVALQRVWGSGAAILLGTGFFQDGSPMDRVLANAVAWNEGRADVPVPVSPEGELRFTNGVWNGAAQMPLAATEVWLRAEDPAGHAGVGNHFTVIASDRDRDGLPDDWEDAFGFDPDDPLDALDDPDGDGLRNLQEFLAGTDPRDGADVLHIRDARPVGTTMVLEFSSVRGRLYRLESAPSLDSASWTVVMDMIEGMGGPQLVQVPLAPGSDLQFYRLVSEDFSERPPFFILQPTDQVTQRGQTARLAAVAGGSLPLHYQWRLAGQNLPGATNESFALDPVTQAHDGMYSLQVSNAFGRTESQAVQLRVDQVLSWGLGDNTVPPGLFEVVGIAAGDGHRLAVNSDGRVVGWGDGTYGQISPPADLTNAVAVAGGYTHSIALRADGTVVGWGSGALGQTDVPPGLSNVVAIASGRDFCAALRSDGRVFAWGYNDEGQTNVPPGLDRVIAIACGMVHTVALRDDGTVVAWGVNWLGQSTVPPGLTNVIAIAAGGNHSLALHSNGTVTAWGGNNDYGESTVPAGLAGVVAIGAGYWHSLAVLGDGTVVGWGSVTVPPGLRNVRAVCGGWSHSVALVDDVLPP